MPSCPSAAVATVYPAFVRDFSIAVRRKRLSSITRMLMSDSPFGAIFALGHECSYAAYRKHAKCQEQGEADHALLLNSAQSRNDEAAIICPRFAQDSDS